MSYEKYVYLGFPWEFEGRRGTIRRPYAPSRMPYQSLGCFHDFDFLDLRGPLGERGGHLHVHPPTVFTFCTKLLKTHISKSAGRASRGALVSFCDDFERVAARHDEFGAAFSSKAERAARRTRWRVAREQKTNVCSAQFCAKVYPTRYRKFEIWSIIGSDIRSGFRTFFQSTGWNDIMTDPPSLENQLLFWLQNRKTSACKRKNSEQLKQRITF